MHKLGVIGKPSDWLISCNINEEKLIKKFNIGLIYISSEELIKSINNHLDVVCPKDLIYASFVQNELNKAYAIYLGIKDLIKKYELEGFTIRCFDLLHVIHSTSCLALALLNDEGIIGTCEGDLPAMISMFLVRKILNVNSFQANPSEINLEDNSLIIAHCTIPLKMTTSYSLMTHYESNIGIGIKGNLKIENCILFRIGADLDKFALLHGHIDENLNRLNLCRTQIKISLKESVDYFLKRPLGNHHLIIYGKEIDKLKDYLISKGLVMIN